MLRRLACILAGACAIVACAATATEDRVNNAPVNLMPGHSVAVGPATLRYERADDSRCPAGVQCIWAGTVTYHFTLASGGQFEAFQLSAEQAAHSSTLRSGLHISLAPFAVPPARAESAAPPVHPVTLAIRTN
jgi:hypothetical protein